MPGPAASPTNENLLIGKGHLLARKYLTGGGLGEWFHMGNVTEATSGNEDTRLEKFSSMSAEAPRYASRLQRRSSTLNVTFDEFSVPNLSLLTMSESTVSAPQAATAVVGEVLRAAVPAATLGAALGDAFFFTSKFGPMSAVTVDLGATTLVAGVDYQIVVNRKGSLALRILPGSTVVTDGVMDLTIDYTPTAYPDGMNVLRASKETTIEVELKFIGDPSSGPAMQVEIWKANVSPQGVLSLISEEFGSGQLAFEMLDDSVNHPDAPLWQITMTDG